MNKSFALSFGCLIRMMMAQPFSAAAPIDGARQNTPVSAILSSPAHSTSARALRIGIVDVDTISERAPQMKYLNSIHTLELQKLEEDVKKVETQIDELGRHLQWLQYQPNKRTAAMRQSEEQMRRNRVKLSEQLTELDRRRGATTERRDKAKAAALTDWVQKVMEEQNGQESLPKFDMVLTGAGGILSKEGAVLYFLPSENLVDLTEDVVKMALRSYDSSALKGEDLEGEDDISAAPF